MNGRTTALTTNNELIQPDASSLNGGCHSTTNNELAQGQTESLNGRTTTLTTNNDLIQPDASSLNGGCHSTTNNELAQGQTKSLNGRTTALTTNNDLIQPDASSLNNSNKLKQLVNKRFSGNDSQFQAYLKTLSPYPCGKRKSDHQRSLALQLTRRCIAFKAQHPEDLDIMLIIRGRSGAEREYLTPDYIADIRTKEHQIYEGVIEYFRKRDSNMKLLPEQKNASESSIYEQRFDSNFLPIEKTFSTAWNKFKEIKIKMARQIYPKLQRQLGLERIKYTSLNKNNVWAAFEPLFKKESNITAHDIWKASSIINDSLSEVGTGYYINYMQSIDILAVARGEESLPKTTTTDGRDIYQNLSDLQNTENTIQDIPLISNEDSSEGQRPNEFTQVDPIHIEDELVPNHEGNSPLSLNIKDNIEVLQDNSIEGVTLTRETFMEQPIDLQESRVVETNEENPQKENNESNLFFPHFIKAFDIHDIIAQATSVRHEQIETPKKKTKTIARS